MPIYVREEVVDGVGMRQIEEMPGTGDDTIGMNAANRNESIAIAVNVMNRHR